MEQINENLALTYVTACDWVHDEHDNEVNLKYELGFKFYDCSYTVNVTREDIDDNNPYITMEGDTALFESFQEMCEDKLWEFIRTKCNEYDEDSK